MVRARGNNNSKNKKKNKQQNLCEKIIKIKTSYRLRIGLGNNEYTNDKKVMFKTTKALIFTGS